MGSLMNQVFYTDAYDLSIVSLIVAVFAVAIVAWVVWELAQVILRHMIGKEYSVRVPFSVRVGLNRRHSPDGFSQDAVDYAAQAGVELVDGSALVGLCRRAWGGQPTTIIPERSARMTRAELMSRIPADMRSRYLKYARTK